MYPDTLYYVWLAARSQRGEGATTPPITVRTKQYGKLSYYIFWHSTKRFFLWARKFLVLGFFGCHKTWPIFLLIFDVEKNDEDFFFGKKTFLREKKMFNEELKSMHSINNSILFVNWFLREHEFSFLKSKKKTNGYLLFTMSLINLLKKSFWCAKTLGTNEVCVRVFVKSQFEYVWVWIHLFTKRIISMAVGHGRIRCLIVLNNLYLLRFCRKMCEWWWCFLKKWTKKRKTI